MATQLGHRIVEGVAGAERQALQRQTQQMAVGELSFEQDRGRYAGLASSSREKGTGGRKKFSGGSQ